MRLSEYTELNWTVTGRCIEWFFIDFEVGKTSIVVKYLHVIDGHWVNADFFNFTIDIEMDAIADYSN